MQFVVSHGEGSPDGETFEHAVRLLFSVAHPIKRIAKQRMGRDFVEPPLEGLWWADHVEDLIAGNMYKLKWRAMIVTADRVTPDMFEEAVATASGRLGQAPDRLRLERFDEGRSVQIIYVGDYRTEAATIARRLHDVFLPRARSRAERASPRDLPERPEPGHT